ncbi:Heparinase II/III-like protein [Nocardioides dokdonensis FR1436]|uniref:Heparinase II/III-like protein n=1 Tax=Nocardioides dokdonensis FR1436 TaxID=1300347 RepID=A0A1A9GGB0_9ACTN|nr:alginate lyase family protein [Nocardioides dokdonensis]ANH36561.1 Heparinase II/III-like protein [Nocardioides dokdonensis FR1436]
MSTSLSWYARRLTRMSTREVVSRVGDEARRAVLAHGRTARTAGPAEGLRTVRRFPSPVPAGVRERVLPHDAAAVTRSADELLAGRWSTLGTERTDLRDPDWFLDPSSGTRAPQSALAFRIDHRDESVTGNVKLVWELSRHHHLSVLACAYWLTGEEEYATAVARQLRSWWAANPVLAGVHWISGIELGVRLVSWVWVRRLLDDWPGVRALFEEDETALRQIRWHQEHLADFPSRGSSANNHAVAEAAGRLVAACSFPWFAESDRWRVEAGEQLRRHLGTNTFPSGLNREQAGDYHRFVTELALLAAVEARAAGHPADGPDPARLASCVDAAAAVLDCAGAGPRHGDGDEGRGLLLTDPAEDAWEQLLGLGRAVVGALPWWPRRHGGVVGTLAGGLLGPVAAAPERASRRPDLFPDAGLALLRTPQHERPEIWCRVDGGPHGFGSLAAHAHADALSLEVRHDGVDVLADPGTYCYHGEPQWRHYFRSTAAHNTIEVDGCDQSVPGGPFLWTSHARTYVDRAEVGDLDRQVWSAHHSGYARLDAGLRHSRTVTLERRSGRLQVLDEVTSTRAHPVRSSFHLGPDVDVRLEGPLARLGWPAPDGGGRVTALLQLPDALEWTAHQGESDPPLGWYSAGLGRRCPSTTLVGRGLVRGRLALHTCLLMGATETLGTSGTGVGHG